MTQRTCTLLWAQKVWVLKIRAARLGGAAAWDQGVCPPTLAGLAPGSVIVCFHSEGSCKEQSLRGGMLKVKNCGGVYDSRHHHKSSNKFEHVE